MTHWLELQEAVYRHGIFINWVASQQLGQPDDLDAIDNDKGKPEFNDRHQILYSTSEFTPSGLGVSRGYRVAKSCPFPNTSVTHLKTDFGAINFIPALQSFLSRHIPHALVSASKYDRFDLYKSILLLLPPMSHTSDLKRLNKLRAHPPTHNRDLRKAPSPGHFDTALVVEDHHLWKSGKGFDGQLFLSMTW
jgi:hypothetical protein